MANTRPINVTAVWGANATTPVPATPVTGTAYRNGALTSTEIEAGQPFNRIVQSGDWNQTLWNTTGMLQLIDQQGILGWSDAVDYTATGAVARGSNGTHYVVTNPSGPNNGGFRDPTDAANRTGFWDTLSASLGVGTGVVDLGLQRTASNFTITSSAGANAPVPAATTLLAGAMTAADRAKLDGIASGADVNVATNLSRTTAASTVTVASSTGTNAILPGATSSTAGVATSAQITKLNGIATGAQVNVATNLSVPTPTATSVTVASSTGASAVLPAATNAAAGVMTASQAQAVASIPSISQWPGVYAGSALNNTTYPVGSYLFPAGDINRNASATIRLNTSDAQRFTVEGSGSIVIGTWRGRGGATRTLMQRVS